VTFVERALTVRCYAKLNLYLDVVGKRPDGYHNIETIFQSVDLYDTITIESALNSVVSVRCDHSALADPKKNIVYRAVRLVQDTFSTDLGATITIEKRIPLGAGLAGGSTDAAGTLTALAELWSLPTDLKTLDEIAGRLGADVPFCMHGGTAVATGTGEILSPIEITRPWWVVIVCPEINVPTSEVYRRVDVRGFEASGDRFKHAVAAVRAGDLPAALYNSMEPVVFDAYPQVRAARDALAAAGGTRVLMTGSGAAVYALVPTEEEAHRLADRIPPQPHRRTFICRTVTPRSGREAAE
jgi:4-diphosphocytidyl-2-C-methyl-D-erythritol kinase